MEEYRHYITWGDILRFFVFLGSVGLAIANFMLLITIGNIHGIWELIEKGSETTGTFTQLIAIYPIIGECILIGMSAIALVALIKGGWDKIKSYHKEGLTFELIFGLTSGLIIGLIVGPIAGLIAEPITRPIAGLLAGLLGGLTAGLIAGLLGGLLGGLIQEFGDK